MENVVLIHSNSIEVNCCSICWKLGGLYVLYCAGMVSKMRTFDIDSYGSAASDLFLNVLRNTQTATRTDTNTTNGTRMSEFSGACVFVSLWEKSTGCMIRVYRLVNLNKSNTAFPATAARRMCVVLGCDVMWYMNDSCHLTCSLKIPKRRGCDSKIDRKLVSVFFFVRSLRCDA